MKILRKNCPCCRTETMPAHFIFADPKTPHRGKDGVFAHRTLFGARSRENKEPIPCKRMQFPQDFE